MNLNLRDVKIVKEWEKFGRRYLKVEAIHVEGNKKYKIVFNQIPLNDLLMQCSQKVDHSCVENEVAIDLRMIGYGNKPLLHFEEIKETKEMTIEEIEKELGYNIKVVK